MQTVIITIHLLIVIALVGVVLIQRSEGGGLGIGGGSGFMTARGTKNALTRLTAILAVCFFLTSIILTVLQLVPGKDGSNILKQIPLQEQKSSSDGLLDQLGGAETGAKNAADNKQGTENIAPAQSNEGIAPVENNAQKTGETQNNAVPQEGQ